jgi:hypothetical protein
LTSWQLAQSSRFTSLPLHLPSQPHHRAYVDDSPEQSHRGPETYVGAVLRDKLPQSANSSNSVTLRTRAFMIGSATDG